MGRAPCCDKENVKRGPWSPEEDAKLKGFIDKYGTGGNWIALPQKAGLKRCGKSCRLRWLNYLRPNIKHGEFTDDENKIICSLYANIGSRWSIIASRLSGRTDNDIKNYWNTKLKKKLLSMLPTSQFPSLPLQSPTPYRPDLFLTNNPSPFNSDTTPSFMNLSNNTLVQNQINITQLSPPDSNSLISLNTNNIYNNNDNGFYLGFQGDPQSIMYNNNHPMEYDISNTKEAMFMFGSGGEGGRYEVSTTGSSSEGGSCSSQISYGNCSKTNHHKKQQQYQMKQEDQFSLQGFGYKSQSFIISNHYTDQKPEGYDLNVYESSLHSEVEEVKQLIGNTNISSYMLNNDDEYKTTHDDDKETCYLY